ncbi:hypothetical protein LOK49_LG15G01064 [Camellia lanceoleosa]|uniref:Uncharacterized protein n=1 Tax=Camellia lanceoleosa TaxID=1840588 RepID=A0ACC0F2G6_9ERIC|nr:hypothetical protein LOK49_LG15G01064 [Camellia lanceoleosa]
MDLLHSHKIYLLSLSLRSAIMVISNLLSQSLQSYFTYSLHCSMRFGPFSLVFD